LPHDDAFDFIKDLLHELGGILSFLHGSGFFNSGSNSGELINLGAGQLAAAQVDGSVPQS